MEYGFVALWLALYLALLFVGVPIASALFPRLADRGASVALPLVLIVVFSVSYVVGRLDATVTSLLAVLVVGAIVLVTLRRGVEFDSEAYLEVAAIFTAAFVFLVAVRAVDPAFVPAGGEKFLDFGLVKSVLRAETIPPEDFWFAGEPVMYYYGGHLVVAQLVRITRTPPAVAYNLALAGFFAAYVTAAYGLAGNVAARDGAFDRPAALLAAFFVAVASNLFTPIRLLLRSLPDGLAEQLARAIGVWVGRTGNEGALITDRSPFRMWDASGIIEVAPGTTGINEFPLFAFVNGDLHAHMMAPPFTLLLATALFAYVRTPAEHRRRRLVLLLGLVPAVGGALAVINTWSFPATAGLTFLALLFDDGTTTTLLPSDLADRLDAAGRAPTELASLVIAAASGLAVALVAVAWSLPFWLANAAGREILFFPVRATLGALLIVHGTFLVPVALYFGYLAWARWGFGRRELGALVVGLLAVVGLAAILDLAVLGLFGPLLVGGYLLGSRLVGRVRRPIPGADGRLARLPGFELVLLLGAAGLVVVVEFAYLDDPAGPERFNTVFKVYAQVWALFAVGTAIALGRLLQLSSVSMPTPNWPTILRGFVAALVVTTSVYGIVGVGQHFGNFVGSDGDATLDGMVGVQTWEPEQAPAIRWLDDREGTPTIVTAPEPGGYSWNGSQSALTGVPTVIGWQHHQRGFGRDPDAVARRADHVRSIYIGGVDTQRRLLARYDVQYVYVGPAEEKRYGGQLTIHRLDAVSPAAEFDAVTIYEVDQSQLVNGTG